MYMNPYAASQRIFGLYEIEIQNYFRAFSPQCDYFVDIGAADGYYSLIYRKYNKHGRILICDGGTGNSEQQKRNLALNNFTLENISFQDKKWIWDVSNNECIRIDDLILDSNRSYFFKIDVDGNELKVLKGGSSHFKNNQCCFIVETHSLALENACIDFLKGFQYECRIIKNSLLRIILPELRKPCEHNRWIVAAKNIALSSNR
ncbi:MAG TPA: FkbM family methyltransferase [Candidatus Margulisiibacteriota bacterium]|nr:FkbM family methyltransferase [Candidatus Margulisiibacteriota bacterium]